MDSIWANCGAIRIEATASSIQKYFPIFTVSSPEAEGLI